MTRRAFHYPTFLAEYRAKCADRGIDPMTGNPTACGDRNWWAQLGLWDDPGPAHSSVEAAAISSIARQARFMAGVPDAIATTTDLPPTMAAQLTELAAEGALRLHQLELPLIELHRRRGETVEEVAGQRMLVPIRKTA